MKDRARSYTQNQAKIIKSIKSSTEKTVDHPLSWSEVTTSRYRSGFTIFWDFLMLYKWKTLTPTQNNPNISQPLRTTRHRNAPPRSIKIYDNWRLHSLPWTTPCLLTAHKKSLCLALPSRTSLAQIPRPWENDLKENTSGCLWFFPSTTSLSTTPLNG